ncbi:MAG: ABC transporter permease [Methanobacteriota archaeon]|nr:MAG: ABC transporter permease [Euryarchaeota archaeon]
MSRYILQRLFGLVGVLFGVSIVLFLALHLAPGDPAQLLLGPLVRPDDLARLREELGLDRPLPIQYVTWLGHVLQGDLGRSIASHRPVLIEIVERFQATALLAGASLLISAVVGITVGVLAAINRGGWIDRASMVLALISMSTPSFWLGMVFIIVFSLVLGVLPGSGMISPRGDGGVLDVLAHLILPALTLAAVPTAVISRLTRSSMLEVIGLDYVRTARGKGLSEQRLVIGHVVPNALIGVATLVGIEAGYLLAGAVLVETVFAWPGLGSLLVTSILKRDFPLVQGGVMLIALSYVLINLATDLAYAYLDPRIRYG